jgi:hypothetical protein
MRVAPTHAGHLSAVRLRPGSTLEARYRSNGPGSPLCRARGPSASEPVVMRLDQPSGPLGDGPQVRQEPVAVEDDRRRVARTAPIEVPDHEVEPVQLGLVSLVDGTREGAKAAVAMDRPHERRRRWRLVLGEGELHRGRADPLARHRDREPPPPSQSRRTSASVRCAWSRARKNPATRPHEICGDPGNRVLDALLRVGQMGDPAEALRAHCAAGHPRPVLEPARLLRRRSHGPPRPTGRRSSSSPGAATGAAATRTSTRGHRIWHAAFWCSGVPGAPARAVTTS